MSQSPAVTEESRAQDRSRWRCPIGKPMSFRRKIDPDYAPFCAVLCLTGHLLDS